jgi:serine phosphatase RsbU (regulator of sigma subunit)
MELFPWTYAIVSLSLANLLMLIRNGIDAWQRSRKGEVWVLWFFAGYLLATLGAVAFYASVIQRMLTASQVGVGSAWNFMQYPFKLDLRNVGEIISGAIMVGILARRLYLLLQEKQLLAAELEAAKQVQDLLLPGAETATAGFAVESAYLPARQVGGDFYFVHPLPGGRLLVVVGDVSGKGLRAAMLVSVVVGILRTAAATSAAAVLQALNAGLVGRTGGGFVTACSVIFEADGTATIANAGHCPVYRDGLEVAMEPNLPLGLVAEATFDEVIAPPGLFVLLSDGVVEAENAQRELFGFERTLAISRRPAQEIAEAAQTWGQTDDITVVTVTSSS